MLENILSSFFREREPFELSLGERSISSSNWDFPPSAFAQAFVDEWKAKRNLSLDEFSLCEIVRSILEHPNNASFWENCKAVRMLDGLNEEEIFLEFRDRMRGFQDKHLDQQVVEYRNTIQKNIRDVQPIVDAIERLLEEARISKNRGRFHYLKSVLVEFSNTLENYKNALDEGELAIRAAANLRNKTGLFRALSDLIGLIKDSDISLPYLKAATLDLSLDNPYRHMMWIPYPAFKKIQELWEDKKDKMLCINAIEQFCDISNLLKETVIASDTERKALFLEALSCAEQGHYNAASLLLFSQSEGLVFDIAVKADKMNFGDFELNIFPDHQNLRKYFSLDGNEKELLSVITLLFDSDLSKFFWPAFLEYFSSDFYSERCLLAHGESSKELTDVEFKTTALFVVTLLETYKDLVEAGKVPVFSECYRSEQKTLSK